MRHVIAIALIVGCTDPTVAGQVEAGRHRWTGRDATGAASEFVYEARVIAPFANSAIDRTSTGFRYVYEIGNLKMARHPLMGCFTEVVHPVESGGSIPEGWVRMGPNKAIPRIAWFARQPSAGIAPGASFAGLEVRSTNWPGPQPMKCNGMAEPISPPDWMTPTQVREFEVLQERELVELQVIGPAIRIDVAAIPDIYAAVVRAYRPSLVKVETPLSRQVIEFLEQLRELAGAAAARPKRIELLDAVTGALSRADERSRWSTELYMALRLCIENLVKLEQSRA